MLWRAETMTPLCLPWKALCNAGYWIHFFMRNEMEFYLIWTCSPQTMAQRSPQSRNHLTWVTSTGLDWGCQTEIQNLVLTVSCATSNKMFSISKHHCSVVLGGAQSCLLTLKYSHELSRSACCSVCPLTIDSAPPGLCASADNEMMNQTDTVLSSQGQQTPRWHR